MDGADFAHKIVSLTKLINPFFLRKNAVNSTLVPKQCQSNDYCYVHKRADIHKNSFE
jgi:hypothetical protein